MAAFLLFALALAAQPVRAASFTAVTRTEHSATRMPAFGDVEVRGVVDGERGRLEYVRGGFATPVGNVIVTSDGGRTATRYDPKEQTCGDTPMVALTASGFRAQAAGLHRYDNVRVEKKLDVAGAKLHGVATRHLRYAISYDMRTGEAAAASLHVLVDSELWVAPSLKDAAFALWLRGVPRTGSDDADRRIGDGMKEATGAALKRIEHTTLQREGGPEQTVTSTTAMEVTRLSLGKPGAGDLEPPFVCRNNTPKR